MSKQQSPAVQGQVAAGMPAPAPPAQVAVVLPEGKGGASVARPKPKEIGGPKGPEPTRYGDWEVDGRCSDF